MNAELYLTASVFFTQGEPFSSEQAVKPNFSYSLTGPV